MRRTARALSAAVLASAALGVFAGPAVADPGVPPGTAESAPCAPPTGLTPATEGDGTVPLPSSRGTARIAAAGDIADAGDVADSGDIADPEDSEDSQVPEADEWTLDGDCADEAAGTGGTGGTDGTGGEADLWGTATVPGEGAAVQPPCPEPAAPGQPCGTAPAPACPEPAAPRGETSAHGTPCTTKPPCPEPAAPRGKSCPAKPPGGVQAGTGGTFSDSVPALVAGGLLIAGACGAAVHRLRLRLRGEDG